MAKSKDEDVETEGLGIDVETAEMLEGDVKKGKARKFILIYKGAQIKKLIVFKKGPFHTRIQKARKDGFKGEAVCGVVTGSGVNLTFQLAGNKEVADAMSVDSAVDDEPTKSTKLKEFLAENKLARKPEYNIIRDVKALAKPEDEDGAPISAGAPLASAPAPPPQKASVSSAPKMDGELAAKLKILKDAVLPKVKEAVAADPSIRTEVADLLETASKQEREGLGDALKTFKRLGEKVKDVLSGKPDEAQKAIYDKTLPGAELKVTTLKEHPQCAAIKAEFDKLSNYLKEAKEFAAKEKYEKANKELEKLAAEYPAAKEMADYIKLVREVEAGFVIRFKNFEQHQGIGAIAPDKVKEVGDKIASLDALIKGRKFRDFITATNDLSGKLDAYKVQANTHGDYVGLRSNALLYIESLEAHPKKDAIKDKIKAIQTDLIDKAQVEYETNKSYEKARALLAQVQRRYKAAKKIADDASGADFTKERDALTLKVKELEKPAHKNPQVDAEVTAIKAQIATAEKYAAVKQYPDAMKLLTEIQKAIMAAETLAAAQLAFNTDEKAAGAAIKDIAKKSQAAVDAVQKMHDGLSKHPNAVSIAFELGEVQKKIDEAKAALA